MAGKDAIDEFIALPREQQLSTLQNLSTEKQNKLLDTVKQRRGGNKGPGPKTIGDMRPLSEKEQLETTFPMGEKGESLGENVHNAARNAFTGAYGVARHPLQTATGLVRSVLPAPIEKAIFGSETQNPAQAMYEGLSTRPGETISTAVGQSAVIDPMVRMGGSATKGLAPRIAETTRNSAQGLVGAGEKPVSGIVAKEATEAGEKAKNAIKSNREAQAQHAAKTADVKDANKEAVRAQSKIAPTHEKLKTASRELQAQIETARNNALKEGNARYNAVNEELNPIAADPEFMQRALVDATEKIKGTSTEPTILKDMTKKLGKGDLPTYEDLQGYYSELGTEISKGSLPGDLYHAYDTLHESIGEEMQRIADSEGKGDALRGARAYWRRMKQAFGKPYNPTDAANVTLEKATGLGASEEQANRVRLLGSFDKTIPQTVEHLGNLRKGIESLPTPKPIREVVKPLPTKPEPTHIHAPEISTRTIRENLLDKWTHGESALTRMDTRRLLGGALGGIIGGLFEGKFGIGIGATAGATFGPVAIAKFADIPAVREWLTRPPKGELDTLRNLPSADRLKITDTLSKVVDQSAKFGKPIKVSPAVTAIIASGLAPRKNATDEWQQMGRQ